MLFTNTLNAHSTTIYNAEHTSLKVVRRRTPPAATDTVHAINLIKILLRRVFVCVVFVCELTNSMDRDNNG